MHAIKGSWVGPTFALAKCNDTGGKKSRIRRSKEERKGLVESFIKRYQKLNNGSFPSLNLTHKEVGGSFYTVRELVREVIQENRVLGPAKFTSEEQSPDTFFEQYPLGSMSIEPETALSSSNGSHILPKHPQDSGEELVLDSTAQCGEPEHRRLNEGPSINGSTQAVEKNEEYLKATYTESCAGVSLQLEENVAELEAAKAKVTQVETGVMVDTVPLTSGSSETSKLTGTLVEKEIEKVETAAGNNNSITEGMNVLESSSYWENGKAEAYIAGPPTVETFPLTSGSRITSGLDEKSTEASELTGTLIEKEIEKVETAAGNNNVATDGTNSLESSSHLENEKAEAYIAGPPIVETFPLTSGSRITSGLDEKSTKASELSGTLVEKEIEKVETAAGNNNFATDGTNIQESSSHLQNEKAEVYSAGPLKVETFPLPSGSRITYGLDEKSSKVSKLTGTLVEKEIEKVRTAAGNNNSIMDGKNLESSSDLENEKAVANIAGPLLDKGCGLLDEKPVGNLDTNDITDPEFEDASPAETEVIDAVAGIDPLGLNGTTTGNSREQSIALKEITTRSNPNTNVEHGGSSLKESTPTLDRMNLESWEKTPKKPAKPETNPLWAFVKSFIVAFVKLWSK